ncbi:MAG: NAD(P)H-dependent oxidoreductase subunit E [Acutalibacteraceae bacterium]
MDKQDLKKVDDIINSYGKSKANLISIMQDVQANFHYLPQEVLVHIADALSISEAKIYSVATFYENFSLEAKGKYVLRVCDGTACHVRKSTVILDTIKEELGLSDKKHSTDDMLFTLETVSCLGACGLSPVMTVNDEVHPAMTKQKVLDLLCELKKEAETDAKNK